MCSIVLRCDANGVAIGANRDEMLDRPWTPPAAHWPDLPGVVAGRDVLAGGTWLGVNRHGVMAAVLNRRGNLGPAPGKRSRGELPLLALSKTDAEAAAARLGAADAGLYRGFNVVIADRNGGWFLRGLERGAPEPRRLGSGTWMVTAGEPNELADRRIARHLPRFEAAGFEDWPALLADDAPPAASALNILPRGGFGTVCSSVIALPRKGTMAWRFAAAPLRTARFEAVALSEAAAEGVGSG